MHHRRVNPEAPRWTKRREPNYPNPPAVCLSLLRLGSAPSDRTPCPSRMSAVEQSIRKECDTSCLVIMTKCMQGIVWGCSEMVEALPSDYCCCIWPRPEGRTDPRWLGHAEWLEMHTSNAKCKGNEDVPRLAFKTLRIFYPRFVEELCKPDNEVDWDCIEMIMNSTVMG